MTLIFCSGAIFIIGNLDYESSHEYYLTVEATDGGTPSLSDVATVNINVTDINDNTPVFSQDPYTAVISEDAVLEQSVITVHIFPSTVFFWVSARIFLGIYPVFLLLLLFLFYLFIYFWLCWVIVAGEGFSSCGACRAQTRGLQRLQHVSSAVAAPGSGPSPVSVARRLSCSLARGILPDQGSDACVLH